MTTPDMTCLLGVFLAMDCVRTMLTCGFFNQHRFRLQHEIEIVPAAMPERLYQRDLVD